MCGIIGYSGKDKLNPSDIKILFLYSQQRGDHAAGFGTNEGVVKENEKASYFIAKNKIPRTTTLIGHTRNPSTNANRTALNAQPFSFDKIIGAHNGYFYGTEGFKAKNKIKTEYSDSYPALWLINKSGIKEAVTQFTWASTFALIWMEKGTDKLHLYRDTKPIFIGQKNGNMFIASVEEYLQAIDCKNIEEIKEHHHYIIEKGEIKSCKEIERTRKVKQTTRSYPRQPSNNKLKETFENVPKIDSHDAPEHAESMFVDAIKRYYWLDGETLFVETVFSHKDTKLEEFKMTDEIEAANAARKYLKIVKAMNKKLESV